MIEKSVPLNNFWFADDSVNRKEKERRELARFPYAYFLKKL